MEEIYISGENTVSPQNELKLWVASEKVKPKSRPGMTAPGLLRSAVLTKMHRVAHLHAMAKRDAVLIVLRFMV